MPDPLGSQGKQVHNLALPSWPFAIAIVAVGIVSGLGGAAFTVLLNIVELILFGFTTGTVAEAATQAQASRRFLAVVSVGCLMAVAWWALRKFGRRVPSVADAERGERMPVGWTVADTALQVMNVGAGGSIGREGAPRQFGAMGADFLSRRFGLSPDQRLVLVACGAGAGLASIYNVPIGGALFALECVLGVTRLRAGAAEAAMLAGAALTSSCLATAVAWIVVPDRPIYPVSTWSMNAWLIAFAILSGPLFGLVGAGFGAAFDALERRAPRGRSILWLMPSSYFALACLAVPFPLVLGNGHALSLQVFEVGLPLDTALWLLLAKPLATFLTVGSGAVGGKLTPSLSTGAVLGITLGTMCGLSPLGAAVVGAGAVLAATMKAPLTAFVLIIEFTASDIATWPAVAVAVFGAALTARCLRRAFGRVSRAGG
jgi:H+/Cl- antiporter ClcA